MRVRLVTSDGVLVWLGGQSSWLPLMTLDVADGHLLVTWYTHKNDASMTAWNGERIDDDNWHIIRVHRYVDVPFFPAVTIKTTALRERRPPSRRIRSPYPKSNSGFRIRMTFKI